MKSSSCDATKEPFIGNRKLQACRESESTGLFEVDGDNYVKPSKK